QRDKFLMDNFRVQDRRHSTGPGGTELPEVVVSSEGVNLRSKVLDHILHDRHDLLFRDCTSAECVFVGNSALILIVIEIKHLILVHNRTNRLTLGARETSHDHVNFFIKNEPS